MSVPQVVPAQLSLTKEVSNLRANLRRMPEKAFCGSGSQELARTPGIHFLSLTWEILCSRSASH